jgi:hypothetical protein
MRRRLDDRRRLGRSFVSRRGPDRPVGGGCEGGNVMREPADVMREQADGG